MGLGSPGILKETNMAIIYRKSDRIWINIHDIQVSVSPLSYHEKSEISKIMLEGKIATAAVQTIKTCLKDIKGLKLVDGSKYELEFDEGKITEECMDDLMNMKHGKDLVLVCLNLLSNIPEEFIDTETGLPLDGISLVKEKKPRKK